MRKIVTSIKVFVKPMKDYEEGTERKTITK